MTYFIQFPTTTYELGGVTTTVKDIFRRVKFITEYAPLSDLYETYTIKDGETPQTLAYDYYGASTYHWVILIFNEIHNPYFDWPMTQLDLQQYTSDKYTEALMYTVKHYEKNGVIVGEYKDFYSTDTWIAPANPGPQDPSILPVSFIDYEDKLNEAKREIRILRPEILSEFVRQFEEELNNNG